MSEINSQVRYHLELRCRGKVLEVLDTNSARRAQRFYRAYYCNHDVGVLVWKYGKYLKFALAKKELWLRGLDERRWNYEKLAIGHDARGYR